METEWDKAKGNANFRKHGIKFDEAAEVFNDPLHMSILDRLFDYDEERWVTLGASSSGAVIVVAHLYYFNEEGREVNRILSARKATRKERNEYEKDG